MLPWVLAYNGFITLPLLWLLSRWQYGGGWSVRFLLVGAMAAVPVVFPYISMEPGFDAYTTAHGAIISDGHLTAAGLHMVLFDTLLAFLVGGFVGMLSSPSEKRRSHSGT